MEGEYFLKRRHSEETLGIDVEDHLHAPEEWHMLLLE